MAELGRRRAALALLEEVGIAAIHAHDVAMADRLRRGLGMPPGDSPIVSVTGPAEDAAASWRRRA